ncbi:MAG: hypothetical protein R3353_00080 [Salegentibacter mishustinae]|nr:hypothetical protein [Salegentibacter mishustinae]
MFKFFFIVIAVVWNSFDSQDNKCSVLSKGTFKLYENNIEVGVIYRDNGFQIEAYQDASNYTIAKYVYKGECRYYLKAYEEKELIDTITWKVTYKQKGKNNFTFEGEPAFQNSSGYLYKGKLVKVSDSINDKKISKIILFLQK